MALVRRPVMAAAMLATAALCGCKVMTLDRAEAIRSRSHADYDATAEVAKLWFDRILPYLGDKAVPLADVVAQGGASAGPRYGRQAGDGSAWTIVVRGEGVVDRIDVANPRGRLVVSPQDGAPVALQVGPLVSGTAIRDALPFVRFDDVPDQIAFADLGAAMTRRALAGVAPVVRTLRPGMRIGFVAVGPLAPDGRLAALTPIAITTRGSAS